MSVEELEHSWGWAIDIDSSAYGAGQYVFRKWMYGHSYAYVRNGKVVN